VPCSPHHASTQNLSLCVSLLVTPKDLPTVRGASSSWVTTVLVSKRSWNLYKEDEGERRRKIAARRTHEKGTCCNTAHIFHIIVLEWLEWLDLSTFNNE